MHVFSLPFCTKLISSLLSHIINDTIHSEGSVQKPVIEIIEAKVLLCTTRNQDPIYKRSSSAQ